MFKRKIRSVAAILPLLLVTETSPAYAQPTATERPDLEKYFAAAGTTGTIVVRRLRDGATTVVNPTRAVIGYTPASTFKILNSILALDGGVVGDIDKDVFPYGGKPFLVDGKPFLPDACNADITMRTAFKFSCIPVYQEIARRIGTARYKQASQALGYGNAAIESAPQDAFWLKGDYRVTPFEQVAFLGRLANEDLPFSKASLDATKDMMIVDQNGAFMLRAKSGYLYSVRPAVGWYVGWVERDREIHLFALNLDIRGPEHARARSAIALEILKELGAP
jgi:beta-lactamase class D